MGLGSKSRTSVFMSFSDTQCLFKNSSSCGDFNGKSLPLLKDDWGKHWALITSMDKLSRSQVGQFRPYPTLVPTPTLPYRTLLPYPYPTLPYHIPTLPYPTPYPTLPYPLLYPTPYHTLLYPYPSLPHSKLPNPTIPYPYPTLLLPYPPPTLPQHTPSLPYL